MRILFISIILFVIIITNKLFLFNEEFLILVSFTGFCFIIYENLSLLLNSRFIEKNFSIKKSLLVSIDGLSNQLNQKKELNKKFYDLSFTLISLKKYYLKLSKQVLIHLIRYLENHEKTKFSKKLKEIKFLENSYSKFILLLILKKTHELSLIKFYFENDLKIKRFKTIKLINNLNSINKI